MSPLDIRIGEIPSNNCLSTLRVKVLMAEAKNTFQVNEKDQKVFGLDNS